MSVLQVPTFSDPSFVETVTFEGTSYLLQFDFNQRCYAWYLSVADADGVDICNGVKLVTGFSLLEKCKDPRKPPGQFWVLSTTNDRSPPGLYELMAGARCGLYYVTSDWVALIQAGIAGSRGATQTVQVPLGVRASLANGSPTVTFASAVTLTPGALLQFSSQPGYTYSVQGVLSLAASVGRWTLSSGGDRVLVPYDGPTVADAYVVQLEQGPTGGLEAALAKIFDQIDGNSATSALSTYGQAPTG